VDGSGCSAVTVKRLIYGPGAGRSVSQPRCYSTEDPRCYVNVILDESTGREVVRVKGVRTASFAERAPPGGELQRRRAASHHHPLFTVNSALEHRHFTCGFSSFVEGC
jgi:hypothetical protein